MWVLILEALLALGLFLFIIWWTMFSGRRQGERDAPDKQGPKDLKDPRGLKDPKDPPA